MLTKPIVFTGRRLVLNYSSAAAGGIRVEIQNTNGVPITGYALTNSPERYGDELQGVMSWTNGPDLGTLAGTPVQLRFILKDADLYSMRFANPGNLQYTVTYNANGATSGSTPATQTKEHDVALKLALSGRGLGEATFLKKTGYLFAGWNTATNGGGTDYAEWSSYTNNASVTLYAKWTPTPASYAVTFNRNGATSGWGPAALAKTHDATLTLPSNITLVRAGYSFARWNTAAGGGGTDYAAGGAYTDNATATFYAQWTELPEPTITAQPTNATVIAGQTATFSVTTLGSAPLACQWYKNDAMIGGATLSSYTTPATTTNDNGAAFKVTVTNAYGAVTSEVATLTVSAPAVADVTVSAATGIGVGTATLNGGVTATNGSPTTFYFMWGTNDYGTASTSPWTVVNCGTATNGQSFSTNLTGLLYGQRYWYYAYATNAYGTRWSSATNFLTAAPSNVITVVASTNSGWVGGGTTGTTSMTTLSVTPGAGRMLIVTIVGEASVNPAAGTPLPVTWAGTPLTVATNKVATPLNNGFAHIYYLVNPAVGTGPLTSTLSNTVNRQCIGAIYASGVGALESVNAAAATASTLNSGQIAASSGALLVDCAGTSYAPFTSGGIVGGGDTVLFNRTDVGSTGGATTYKINGAGGNVSATWTSSGSDHIAVAIASFAPASAIGLVNGNATNITAGSATLNGTLTGSNSTWDVYAYWGPTNGTNNPSAWSNGVKVGTYTLSGVASTNIACTASAGIAAGATNYYTFLATCAATNLWASPSTVFTAGTWSAYEAWQHLYFTAAELTNAVISGDNGDKDGDRFPNWMEFQAGTDPTNGASFLGVTEFASQAGGSGYVVTWPSVTGKVYALQSATNLVTPGFTNIASNVQATPTQNVYTDVVDNAAVRFYRVTVE
jgi:uncharacterized repeat protein (TIGR02543 family)